MLEPNGLCSDCSGGNFEVTVTRTDKIVLDPDGEVEDREGSDVVSDVTCTNCGTVVLSSDDLKRLV